LAQRCLSQFSMRTIEPRCQPITKKIAFCKKVAADQYGYDETYFFHEKSLGKFIFAIKINDAGNFWRVLYALQINAV